MSESRRFGPNWRGSKQTDDERLRRIRTVEPIDLNRLHGLHGKVCLRRGSGIGGGFENGVNLGAWWREGADGVGGGGVSGDEQGLAAAAAEVDFAAVAGATWLLHPVFAPEFLKGSGRIPDFAQAAVLHIVERQSRNNFCGVTGKRIAFGGDEHKLACPAAHARFGKTCVIIGDDKFQA